MRSWSKLLVAIFLCVFLSTLFVVRYRASFNSFLHSVEGGGGDVNDYEATASAVQSIDARLRRAEAKLAASGVAAEGSRSTPSRAQVPLVENTGKAGLFSSEQDYSRGAVEPALENRCLRPGPRRLNKTWAAVAGIMHETAAHLPWVSSLRNQDVDVIIYDKTRPSAKHYLPNDTTKEDGPYLAYIVNYYDCLPPYTIFLHSQTPSMHGVDLLLPCLRKTPLRAASRMWLMLGDCTTCFTDGCPRDQSTTDFQARLWERLTERGFGSDLPPRPDSNKPLHMSKCPQFIASRESIQQWPREFWVVVLQYVYSVSRSLKIAKVPHPKSDEPDDWHTITPFWTGNGMEQTWMLLFDTAYGRNPASSNDLCQVFRPGCVCNDERYSSRL